MRGSRLVWTGEIELPGVDVLCRDGRVEKVGPALDPGGDDLLDASDCIVTPGLVNAHHHLLQTAFRTLPEARHVPMKRWLAVMAREYGRVGVDGELAEAAAAAGLAESLLAGVTTVADHHLTWPRDGSNGREIAAGTFAAARRLGARLVFVRGTAGDAPDVAAASTEEIVSLVADDRLVSVAVGPAGIHSDGREMFDALSEVAHRYGLRRRTQANEQVDVAQAAERYGARPLDLLADWGWLAPDVTLAHLCGITDTEIVLVATSGASVTHAPGCDLPMGWGVAPVAALRSRGVAVGLGTSGGGSNDAGHLLADARLAMQVAPLGGGTLTARDVLAMATAGSSAGLGRSDLGRLEPGAAADLVCWDVGGVADAGVTDLLAGLVWAAPGRRPRHVVVDGTVVVRDGILAVDEREIAADLRTLLSKRTGESGKELNAGEWMR